MAFLTVHDLAPFAPELDAEKAQHMIEDASAMAVLAAPCLGADPSTLSEGKLAAVRAIIRGAVLRWNEAGTGALQAQTVGPFGQTLDTRQNRRGMFWPSEIADLQGICNEGSPGGAFSIDTGSTSTVVHADICAVNFGALYCSCGAVLTAGLPLYEYDV